MRLMAQCYALGPPEELAPGHPDWDATDDPMLCSIGPSEELAPGHPDWNASGDFALHWSEHLLPDRPHARSSPHFFCSCCGENS
jgi:hypothetical protein